MLDLIHSDSFGFVQIQLYLIYGTSTTIETIEWDRIPSNYMNVIELMGTYQMP